MTTQRSWLSAAVALFLLFAWASSGIATPYEEDLEEEDDEHIVRLVRSVHMIGPDGQIDQRVAETDLRFIEQMGRHHQGAVEMSEAYLDDARGRNPVLRRLASGIIANQEIEINVLKDVGAKVAAGPRTVLHVGGARVVALNRGVDGLEHVWRFRKSPPPSALDIWLTPDFTVSDFDVQFVRPMKAHHEAALQMASDYNSSPIANNLLLRRLNNEIIVDQRYEIGFIDSVLARYSGDPATVPDDPRMMEIMHWSMGDMMHGRGGSMEMPAD